MGNACITHCCPKHGCKYGIGTWREDDVCVIVTRLEQPRYPANNGCEQCEPEFAAVQAAKDKADEWNVCDPQASIPAEAAKQIAYAALEAYHGGGY